MDYRGSGFSWKPDIHHFPAVAGRTRTSAQGVFAAPRHLGYLNREPSSGWLSRLRPPPQSITGTGILTRSPSTTPFGLALGPDSPSADEPAGGTLRVSGCRILTYIFATQADILTSARSTPALANASLLTERSSTTCIKQVHSFGTMLSPVHFRRRNA
jgi:hypothetical protein